MEHIQDKKVVEPTGIEPVSEIDHGKDATCLVLAKSSWLIHTRTHVCNPQSD